MATEVWEILASCGRYESGSDVTKILSFMHMLIKNNDEENLLLFIENGSRIPWCPRIWLYCVLEAV